ncbi:beta-1,4-xylosyltransferase IRX9-like, partial [Prosopis cineraria]|uniref:beta-1,4-xylosyltransferase IRX9-like n=1 Tax=Prosopis cineraria TaxID=364024 RepID=UPI002410841B
FFYSSNKYVEPLKASTLYYLTFFCFISDPSSLIYQKIAFCCSDCFYRKWALERSKKGIQLWKKAMIHFSLCFVMGFFTGFAPTGKSSFVSTQAASASNGIQFAPQAIEMSHDQTTNVNRSLISPSSRVPKHKTGSYVREELGLKPGRHVIIVTPTSSKIPFQEVLLRRLANTIKLVPQPLLWIVVEPPTESTELSEILRKQESCTDIWCPRKLHRPGS